MPHTFWHARHHPWIVGQDCILRAGFRPALGGLPTRRTQGVPRPICPTILAKFQASGKVCGIGHSCLPRRDSSRCLVPSAENRHHRLRLAAMLGRLAACARPRGCPGLPPQSGADTAVWPIVDRPQLIKLPHNSARIQAVLPMNRGGGRFCVAHGSRCLVRRFKFCLRIAR